MTNKEKLIQCFESAKGMKMNYVAVIVKLPNQAAPEMIINYSPSFDTKLEYYKNTYDEQLVMNHNKEIKIIACDAAWDLEDFTDLYEMYKAV